ncbi:MAG: acyl-CoA thioesterase [Candidatus Tectomicrobia bacterium]|uniref:Acyl-CoA thioesterase n=1 Tax=Tectimicrobiota bacterium TaxID=2528274 RepID=A0A938B3Y7_UNCTE|nr:acyl-CoA thioesterase [Candidatus Tectomicrobia bacterium]
MTSPIDFFYPMRVQFEHTDAQGRVFYAHYLRLLDQARCAYWEALGFTIDDVRQIENDTVIVHLEADYLGPAAFYDLLHITVAAQRLGRSSLHLTYRVLHAETRQEICTARMVMVQVDLATETSRPWSTAFRAALMRYHGPQIAPAAVET